MTEQKQKERTSSPKKETEPLSTQTGTVLGVVYKKPETNWGIARVRFERRVFWVKGEILPIQVGALYQFGGWWEEQEPWGKGLRIHFLREIIPENNEQLIEYLITLRLPRLHKQRCREIVESKGMRTLQLIEEDPTSLQEFGLSKAQTLQIQRVWQRKLPSRSLLATPEWWGLNAQQAQQLFHRYQGKTLTILKQNPYAAVSGAGLDFHLADELATRMGINRQDPRRASAAILQILHQAASQEGHTALSRTELLARTRSQKLQLDPKTAQKEILQMEREETLLSDPSGQFLGLSELIDAETYIAEKILQFNTLPARRKIKLSSGNLNVGQAKAVKAAQQNRILILTGSPGTGKTYTLRSILDAGWKNPMLAAPTGKAAKRLSSLTNHPAFTLHRLLDVHPEQNQMTQGRQEPLDTDLLIVDEASMLDISLAATLFRSIDPNKTHLILCGDADQLPPVGPGNFLRDLIDSEKVPICKLQQIMRQGAESQIIYNAKRAIKGEALQVNNQKFKDFKYLNIDAATRVDEEKNLLTTLKELFTVLQEHGYGREDIQVLTPMKKGSIPGAQALNKHLQNYLNPKKSRQHNAIFRKNDRVIQLRNNYELGVFNGDTGVVEECSEQELQVRFDERIVLYEKESHNQLELAYAISIHKSQGSEWPVVLLPLSLSHKKMFRRGLIYTGMTRAKKLLILIGSEKAVGYAISEHEDGERITTLLGWLRYESPQLAVACE